MESNRDEAYRCIELTKLYIKKKDLDTAWKFSIKANKLFPTSETKRLVKKLQLKVSKRQKQKQSVSDNSDGNESSPSSNNGCNIQKQHTKKCKSSCTSSTTYSYSMFKGINKDESFKCIEKAEKCIHNKEFKLAEKFLIKSKKLFPLPRADELLKKLHESKPNYTEEQANLIEKIKSSENFYIMLGIKTTATVPEIKKAFKKLALLLHPDKNSAPGSGEVFVVVRNAVDTLCDHSKRKTYDLSIRKPTAYTCSPNTQTSFSREPENFHKKFPFKYNYYKFDEHPSDIYDEMFDYCEAEENIEDYDWYEYYDTAYDY